MKNDDSISTCGDDELAECQKILSALLHYDPLLQETGQKFASSGDDVLDQRFQDEHGLKMHYLLTPAIHRDEQKCQDQMRRDALNFFADTLLQIASQHQPGVALDRLYALLLQNAQKAAEPATALQLYKQMLRCDLPQHLNDQAVFLYLDTLEDCYADLNPDIAPTELVQSYDDLLRELPLSLAMAEVDNPFFDAMAPVTDDNRPSLSLAERITTLQTAFQARQADWVEFLPEDVYCIAPGEADPEALAILEAIDTNTQDSDAAHQAIVSAIFLSLDRDAPEPAEHCFTAQCDTLLLHIQKNVHAWELNQVEEARLASTLGDLADIANPLLFAKVSRTLCDKFTLPIAAELMRDNLELATGSAAACGGAKMVVKKKQAEGGNALAKAVRDVLARPTDVPLPDPALTGGTQAKNGFNFK